MLGEQSAVEVLQCQLGHSHPLSGVVAHGKGSCSPSRHGHTILWDNSRPMKKTFTSFNALIELDIADHVWNANVQQSDIMSGTSACCHSPVSPVPQAAVSPREDAVKHSNLLYSAIFMSWSPIPSCVFIACSSIRFMTFITTICHEADKMFSSLMSAATLSIFTFQSVGMTSNWWRLMLANRQLTGFRTLLCVCFTLSSKLLHTSWRAVSRPATSGRIFFPLTLYWMKWCTDVRTKRVQWGGNKAQRAVCPLTAKSLLTLATTSQQG